MGSPPGLCFSTDKGKDYDISVLPTQYTSMPDYKVVLCITHSHQDEIEEPLVALKITPTVGWVSDSYVSHLLLRDTWDRTTTSNPLDIFPLCCIKKIHEVAFACRP